jgi:hypothetical protein
MDMTLRSAFLSTSTLALLSLLACDPKVAVPDDEQELADAGDNDDDEASSDAGSAEGNSAEGGSADAGTSVGCDDDSCATTGDDPPPPTGEQHAYAIHWGDVPPIDVGESGTGGSGGDPGGPGPFGDAESIFVSIGIGNDSCANPWGDGGCGQWSVSFTLPADVVPGSYPLVELNGSQFATGPDEGAGECWGGGGSLDGTLVIGSIDDATIVGHIEDAVSFDFDANISFVAPLCG